MEVKSPVVANGEVRSNARTWRPLVKAALTVATATTVDAAVVEVGVVVAAVVILAAVVVETALSTKSHLVHNNQSPEDAGRRNTNMDIYQSCLILSRG
jgi:hypothetical protein